MLMRCGECGLGMVHPRPTQADLEPFYHGEYYGTRGSLGVVQSIFKRLAGRVRTGIVASLLPRGRLLDAGCGDGFFLEACRGTGRYELAGQDLSPLSDRLCRTLPGLVYHAGPLSSLPGAGLFDAITAWASFEHFTDPCGEIREIRRLLKPGGGLLVMIPNSRGWQARISPRHWFHLDIPRHVFHYDQRNIVRLLEKEGFTVVRTRHGLWEHSVFGWFQTLLNLVGFRFNLFYRFIKHGRMERPVQLAACFLLSPLVFALSVALHVAESTAGQSGIIIVTARRNG